MKKTHRKQAKSLPEIDTANDIWNTISKNNDCPELEEFFEEATDVPTTSEALFRDIDLWEMKRSQKLFQSVTNASIMSCNYKLQKLRGLKMDDLRYTATNLPKVNSEMISTIFHRPPPPPKPVKTHFWKNEFDPGFEDETAKKKFMKSQEFMARECNQRIAKELIVKRQHNESALKDPKQMLGFTKNFRVMSSMQMEHKIYDLIRQLNNEKKINTTSPKQLFDFSKEFRMFRNLSYSTEKMMQTLQKIITDVSNDINIKKTSLKEIRRKYAQLSAHSLNMNNYIEKANDKEKPAGAAKKTKIAKFSMSLFGNNQKEEEDQTENIVKETLQRIITIKLKMETLNKTMESLGGELVKLKMAKSDAIKILKELYFYILENEDEYAEKSLRPVFKGFLIWEQELPEERIPKYLDKEAVEFLWTVCNLEINADKLLGTASSQFSQEVLGGSPGTPKNIKDHHKRPIVTPLSGLAASGSLPSFKSPLELSANTQMSHWKKKELSVRSSLRSSCNNKSANLGCFDQRGNLTRRTGGAKEINSSVFGKSQDSSTMDKRGKEAVLELYKEITEISKKEKERLFVLFKKDQVTIPKILMAEFGKKEYERTLYEFKTNQFEEQKKKEVTLSKSESKILREKLYLSPPGSRSCLKPPVFSRNGSSELNTEDIQFLSQRNTHRPYK